MIYLGMDNGSTSTIGIVNSDRTICEFFKTPIIKELNYCTSKKGFTSEPDIEKFASIVKEAIGDSKEPILAIMERPFSTNVSYLKNAEKFAYAFFILQKNALKLMGIGYIVIDSKKWQRDLFPKGTTGSGDLKRASKDIGCRLYPKHATLITKHKDADGLLIAEYARKNNL